MLFFRMQNEAKNNFTRMGKGQRGKQMEAINDILGTVEQYILLGCLVDVWKSPGHDRLMLLLSLL